MRDILPTVIQLEQAAARAWPAQRVVDVSGWTVRLSGGGTRRANSVLPLAFHGDVEAAITRVEGLYVAQKTRAYFQVSSASTPADLDDRLAARGYAAEEPCLLLARAVRPHDGSTIAELTVSEAPTPAWIEVYTAGLDPARKAAAPALLATVPQRRAFFLIHRNGAPLATTLGVLSPDGIIIVESVATLPVARRTGAATRAMDALEAWAAREGAKTLALQVVEANVPARALYAKRGYVERGRYHYRYKDVV